MTAPLPMTFEPAERLEAHLGDPLESTSPLSFAAAVARDEGDVYPAEAMNVLDDWGLCDHYVPAELGGALRQYETAQALVRVVARRDVTTAVAHAKTYLGSSPVWVSGSAGQRARVAELVRSRRRVSLALTEELHGSDLVAGDVVAERSSDGWRLHGAKWAISNATRGHALSVLARTDAAGGPRGLSVFFVDKSALPAGTFSNTRRLKTHGVRGADISGIRFDDAPVSADDLVGEPGAGLEIVLKSLQISRGLVGALSLGAGDTALRATLAFARSRRLYGDALTAIPYVRHVLTTALVDLLMCECVSIGACRLLHHCPEVMASVSAVAKYFVPTMVEDVTRRLAVVLGARYYLREGHWAGIFEKMLRDAALVSLFDGSTVVNLSALGVQLRLWAIRRGSAPPCPVEGLFDLRREAPPFSPSRLVLVHNGPHEVIESLAAWDEREIAEAAVEDDVRAALLRARPVLAGELERLAADMRAATTSPAPGFARSPELFALARRYCDLYAAASCLLAWRANRTGETSFIARGDWLALALGRVLESLGRDVAVAPSVEERTWSQLLELDEDDRLFSLVPLRVASARAVQRR